MPTNAPPLVETRIIPDQSYYGSQSFLARIPLAASQLDPKVANELGEDIKRIALEDLQGREGHGHNKALPGGVGETIQWKIVNGALEITAGGPLAPYAVFLEFGSSTNKHPEETRFLKPAIQEAMGGAKRKVGDSILARARIGAGLTGSGNVMPMMGEAAGLSGLIALGAAGMTAFSGMFSFMTM